LIAYLMLLQWGIVFASEEAGAQKNDRRDKNEFIR